MNKTLIVTLVVVGGIVLGAILFGAGMMVGRANFGFFGMNPSNLMNWTSGGNQARYSMMGNGYNMMGGYGMMGGYRFGADSNVKPLSVDQAKQAVEGYLKGLNNPDLEIKEIMIFDNNAYARITEKSTGTGAFELLVDPTSLSVFPEFGPNMMWNLKYGHMVNNGMMGGRGRFGMMGGLYANPGSVSATMTVTSDQALKIAQQYLDQQNSGYQAATDADPFYGYYTIDYLKDNKPAGMLSVNGFSGQVFIHTWHGNFIEMFE